VGASTEPELKERKARVEDALAATRAAVEEGIVPGGGVAYLRCLAGLEKLDLREDEEIAKTIVTRALEEPVKIIAANAGEDGPVVLNAIRGSSESNFGYDAVSGQFGDMLVRGIIDPAKVARAALQNAASVAGMILTTQSLISEEKAEEHGHDHVH